MPHQLYVTYLVSSHMSVRHIISPTCKNNSIQKRKKNQVNYPQRFFISHSPKNIEPTLTYSGRPFFPNPNSESAVDHVEFNFPWTILAVLPSTFAQNVENCRILTSPDTTVSLPKLPAEFATNKADFSSP